VQLPIAADASGSEVIEPKETSIVARSAAAELLDFSTTAEAVS
jgi:hypothetical protein